MEQLLQALEEHDDVSNSQTQIDIFAVPPIDGDDTDLDEDLSDDEHVADLNCLGPKMLKTECEVRTREEEIQKVPTVSDVQNRIDSDSNWDSSDDEPLSKYAKTKDTKPKVVKKQFKWKKMKPSFRMNVNCIEIPLSQEASQCKNPIDFLKLFLTEDLLKIMMDQTNLYSAQKNKLINMTMNEMYVFIGGLLLSGYAKYPQKRMFWSSSPDVPNILQNSIRLNRFEQILRNFHLNDNTQIDRNDRLFKLRPMITHLKEAFRLHGGLQEHLSIDESMIPYYGKHYAKQFIKGKPIRFGFKNWTLCTANGYMISFEKDVVKYAPKRLILFVKNVTLVCTQNIVLRPITPIVNN